MTALVIVGVAMGRTFQLLPEPLRLPPFSERVALKVEAQWTDEGCMDVVTITNLPRGTHFTVGVRPQFEATGDSPRDLAASSTLSDGFDVMSRRPRLKHQRVFCKPHRWSKHDVFGVKLTLLVAQLTHFHRWKKRPKGQEETPAERRQRQLIGERGELLKGPLARQRNWVPGPNPGFYAESKSFVLPLPKEEE